MKEREAAPCRGGYTSVLEEESDSVSLSHTQDLQKLQCNVFSHVFKSNKGAFSRHLNAGVLRIIHLHLEG